MLERFCGPCQGHPLGPGKHLLVYSVWNGEPVKGFMQRCVIVTSGGMGRKDLVISERQELKVHCSSPKDPILKKGREEGGRESGKIEIRKEVGRTKRKEIHT